MFRRNQIDTRPLAQPSTERVSAELAGEWGTLLTADRATTHTKEHVPVAGDTAPQPPSAQSRRKCGPSSHLAPQLC